MVLTFKIPGKTDTTSESSQDMHRITGQNLNVPIDQTVTWGIR